MDLYKELNNNQVEAVKALDGRIRVVAGAGSGKTKVLCHRYARLVEKIGIHITRLKETPKSSASGRNRAIIPSLVKLNMIISFKYLNIPKLFFIFAL